MPCRRRAKRTRLMALVRQHDHDNRNVSCEVSVARRAHCYRFRGSLVGGVQLCGPFSDACRSNSWGCLDRSRLLARGESSLLCLWPSSVVDVSKWLALVVVGSQAAL